MKPNLCGGALNVRFAKPPLTALTGVKMHPRPLRSLPVSETSLQCGNQISDPHLRGQGNLASRPDERQKGSVTGTPGTGHLAFSIIAADQLMDTAPFTNQSNRTELPNHLNGSGRNLASFFNPHADSLTEQVGQRLSKHPTKMTI